jgi:hypothetical protein
MRINKISYYVLRTYVSSSSSAERPKTMPLREESSESKRPFSFTIKVSVEVSAKLGIKEEEEEEEFYCQFHILILQMMQSGYLLVSLFWQIVEEVRQILS